jgi:hypothetical protein
VPPVTLQKIKTGETLINEGLFDPLYYLMEGES